MRMRHTTQCGFTLIEMIVVIVITGIIGGMVAMFIRAPVQGYVDSANRAEMGDIADTALRRLARDIRTAVPNSVRLPTPAGSTYIEFLPTRDGGRYRANATGGAGNLCNVVAGNTAGDALNFDNPDTCFEIIGRPITFVAGDQIVIGSTQSDGNPPYQDPTAAACGVAATTTCIRRAIAAVGVGVDMQEVRMTSGTTLPPFAELSTQRFDVVDGTQQAVTYACEPTVGVACAIVGDEGTCQLRRYWRYGFQAAQQTPAQIAVLAHTVAILADRVSTCNIVYDPVSQRNGLVAIRLGITRGGESISLYHTIHVNNVP